MPEMIPGQQSPAWPGWREGRERSRQQSHKDSGAFFSLNCAGSRDASVVPPPASWADYGVAGLRTG